MLSIEERDKIRFNIFSKIFELSNFSHSTFMNMWEIGDELGYDRITTKTAIEYLVGMGLIKIVALGGMITITQDGINYYENIEREPNQSLSYFPNINVINVENMINSQVQQNTTSSYQKINIAKEDKEYLLNLLNEIKGIKDKIPETFKKDVEGEIQTIEGQLKISKPKIAFIIESFKSIKNVLENINSLEFGNIIESIKALF